MYMKMKNPIGEVLTRDHGNERYTIVGVAKDMICESPFEPVRQQIFFFTESLINTLETKFNSFKKSKTCNMLKINPNLVRKMYS